MSDERPSDRSEPAQPSAEEVEQAAAHLDEDAEAWEDPVHSGEARHQHEVHEHQHPEQQGAPAAEPAAGPGE